MFAKIRFIFFQTKKMSVFFNIIFILLCNSGEISYLCIESNQEDE